MSFEDFEALFALERETAKKEAKTKRPPPVTAELHLPPSRQLTTDLSRSLEYDTALDTLPSDGITSPTSAHDTGRQRAKLIPTWKITHAVGGFTAKPAWMNTRNTSALAQTAGKEGRTLLISEVSRIQLHLRKGHDFSLNFL